MDHAKIDGIARIGSIDEAARIDIICEVLGRLATDGGLKSSGCDEGWNVIVNTTLASKDVEVRREAAVLLEKLVVNPSRLPIFLELVKRFSGSNKLPPAENDVAEFVSSLGSGSEIEAAVQEFSYELLSLANRAATISALPSRATPFGAKSEVEPVTLADFPRIWDLLSFLLPPNVRRENFEPSRAEVITDYVRAKGMRPTRWEVCWLNSCFSLQITIILLQSLFAAANDRTRRWFKWLLLTILGDHLFRICCRITEELLRRK